MKKFTFDEAQWMLQAVNGSTLSPEKLIPNQLINTFYKETEFNDAPPGLLARISSFSVQEIKDLYSKLYAFWDLGDEVEDSEQRFFDIGLIEYQGGC